MGLRETIAKKPGLVTALAVIAVLVCGYMVFKTVRGSARPTLATKAFFTTDDGKTWFIDDVAKAPPFKTAEGKEAVAANVVSCKGGKDPFVLYVWRYTAEGKAEVEAGKTNPGTAFKREVKKPGAKDWVRTADVVRSSTIEAIECPPGQSDFVQVDP